MSKHTIYWELMEMLDPAVAVERSRPGKGRPAEMTHSRRPLSEVNLDQAQAPCPVCRLVERKVHDYLDALLYENVNDIPIRDRLRAAHGLCRVHAWQLAQMRDGLGSAIIYKDVLNAILKELEQTRYGGGGTLGSFARRLMGGGGISPAENHDQRRTNTAASRRLVPHATCPACETADHMADVYLESLLEHITAPQFWEKYEPSGGLCIPHLRRGLELARDEAGFRRLVEAQIKGMQALGAELDEFIRKTDYRFTDEEWGAERDSWLRAIETVVGSPHI